jgi:hypothetical protein
MSVRPERVSLVEPGSTSSQLRGRVRRVVYAGPLVQVIVDLGAAGSIQAVAPNLGNGPGWQPGEEVGVALPPDAIMLLEAEAT